MIKYTLKCDGGHTFESWFSGSADYDRLHAGKLLACAVCGTDAVEKALMAPAVSAADEARSAPERPLSAPLHPAEQALRALRRKIETEAEDVGRRFATEARAIHEGEAAARPIYGEARADEARALIEDGIPVAPIPWFRRSDA